MKERLAKRSVIKPPCCRKTKRRIIVNIAVNFSYQLLSSEVCSNYISPGSLFYGIFLLTDFLSDPFVFSSA